MDKEKAASTPNPAPSTPTPGSAEEDASTGEIISYSLGSVAGNFAGSSLYVFAAILMIVFKINALVVGLIQSIDIMCGGFMDPVMASITDNFRSKWGRRRPFILVAGILLPLVSVFGWMYMPRTSKVEPNIRAIPLVDSSDVIVKNFGKMLVAYNTDTTTIHARPVENATGKRLPSTLDNILKDAVGKLSSTLVWTEGSANNPGPDITLITKIAEASQDVVDQTAPLGFQMTVWMQAVDRAGKTIGSDSLRVTLNERFDLKERKRTFAERLGAMARGETKTVGLLHTGRDLELRTNIAQERSDHRALVSAMEIALVKSLGECLRVPFWRCLPENAQVPLEFKERMKQSLPAAPEQYQPRLKGFVYASGHNVDLKSDPWSPADWKIVEQMKKETAVTEDRALYVHLWENLPLDLGEARIKFFRNPPKPKKEEGLWSKTVAGFAALKTSTAEDKKVAIFALVFLLVMSAVRTVFNVPFYALGIELAPSYHGRTKVVIWRSVFDKIISFKNPWLLPICLLAFFTDAAQGAMYLSIVFAIIAIPMVIATFVKTKERTHVDKSRQKVPFLKSIRHTVNNRHFWKIVALYVIISTSLGIFAMVSMFVTIYYVFRGDLLLGSTYTAILGSMGVAFSFLSIPLVSWLCKKYQKHNAMIVAIVLMMIGDVIKWWCYNPNYPELIFIEAFFFSLGISSVFTILPTLMADVTDVDELYSGSRREGMFGAVNSWLMKGAGAFTAVAAGVIVTISGFNVNLGVHQEPGVFTTMRIMFSVMPAALLSIALVILYKYPLTEQRMREIKEQLRLRREPPSSAAG